MIYDAREVSPLLQLTRLALLALACAFAAVALGELTGVGNWIYLAAPILAGAAEGLHEIRRSGPVAALALAGSTFAVTVIFMVMGALLLFLIHDLPQLSPAPSD